MHRSSILSVLFVLATMTTSLSAQGASAPRYLALGDSVTFGFITQAALNTSTRTTLLVFRPTLASMQN